MELLVSTSVFPKIQPPMKHSAEVRGDLARILFMAFLALVFLSLFFIPSLARLL